MPDHPTVDAPSSLPRKGDDKPSLQTQPMWKTTACGLAMGAADIVPGVSGGTVALILGIYHRLLSALSHIDSTFLQLLSKKQWSAAAKHMDLKFLVALAIGILTGAIGLASLLEHLLTEHRSFTFALFFGLILASGVLVGRMVKTKNKSEILLCLGIGVVGIAIALWLSYQGRFEAIPGLPYTFLCGLIGISAMILPGISGAHLLLLLGKYEEMTSIIKGLPRGQATQEELLTVGVFCVGCLVGLLLFSRFIRWLLDRYQAPTLAALCGFMIGSLLRVWPFQMDKTPEVEEFKHKLFEPHFPTSLSSDVAICIAIAIAGFFFVLIADRIASTKDRSKQSK